MEATADALLIIQEALGDAARAGQKRRYTQLARQSRPPLSPTLRRTGQRKRARLRRVTDVTREATRAADRLRDVDKLLAEEPARRTALRKLLLHRRQRALADRQAQRQRDEWQSMEAEDSDSGKADDMTTAEYCVPALPTHYLPEEHDDTVLREVIMMERRFLKNKRVLALHPPRNCLRVPSLYRERLQRKHERQS